MDINFEELLLELLKINGIEKVALLNMIKKEIECGFNIDDNSGPLVQAMSDIVRTNIKYTRLSSLKICFEDILISYDNEIHLLTPFSCMNNCFLYIGIAKNSNIALIRLKLNECLSIHLSVPVRL